MTPAEVSRLRDLQAIIHVKLGVNYIQTEENQTGEGHLLHALGWLLQRFLHPSNLSPISTFRRVSSHYATELSSLSGILSTDTNSSSVTAVAIDIANQESKTDGSRSSQRPYPIGGLIFSDFVGLACITLECINYLALIYSGWDNHARSLKCLRLGKNVYRRIRAFQDTINERQQKQSPVSASSGTEPSTSTVHDSTINNIPLLYEATSIIDHLDNNNDNQSSLYPSLQKSILLNAHRNSLTTLDSLYTHLLFYYAQIYGHLHAPVIAAYYVERTLSRQLAEQELKDPFVRTDGASTVPAVPSSSIATVSTVDTETLTEKLEWVRNVLRLTEYHVGRKNWRASAICCYAAEAMLGTVLAKYGTVDASTDNNTALSSSSSSSDTPTTPLITITVEVTKLPEPLQRLLAESATHWGLVYETMLRIARDRDFANANGLTDPSVSENTDTDEDAATDPFSTSALINFGKYKQEDGISSIRGDGEDLINIDDSDHEAEVDLATVRLDTVPTKPSTEPKIVPRGGPLAEFIAKVRPVYKPYILSYGPSRLGDDILCPGATYASSLIDLPEPSRITTFETARDVFKGALAAFSRAKEYFILDGFVTEYIGIQTGISRIYKYLAFYEPDEKRIAAMHGRRIASLEPLLKELNSNVYMRYHREIALEMASTWQEIFEIRLSKLETRLNTVQSSHQGPKKTEIDSINEAADGAIRNYCHFIRCFDDSRLPTPVPMDDRNTPLPKLAGATPFVEDDESTAEAYMTAHFCLARILTRKLSPELPSRISDQKAAFDRFTWIIKAVPKLATIVSRTNTTGSNSSFFRNEVHMCKEMVSLLPAKIDHMQRKGIDLQAPGTGRFQ